MFCFKIAFAERTTHCILSDLWTVTRIYMSIKLETGSVKMELRQWSFQPFNSLS